MGSLARDAKYWNVPNISCPKCFQGRVDCVVRLSHGIDKKHELVYAECDPMSCKYNQAEKEKLLSRCMEYIRDYEEARSRLK